MPNLPKSRRGLPVRSRQRINADYRQAAGLLRHDLVWSSDFDGIRLALADLIDRYIKAEIYPEPMSEIVRQLIADENDLTI